MKLSASRTAVLLSASACAWSTAAMLAPTLGKEAQHVLAKEQATGLSSTTSGNEAQHVLAKEQVTALSSTKSDYQVIASPKPEGLAGMQGAHIDDKHIMHNTTTQTPAGGSVTIKAFPYYEDQYVSGALHRGQGWETGEVHKIYDTWVQAGRKGNFLDIGANIGSWSLPLASAFHSSGKKVIAIEAMPPIADYFRAGVVANQADNIIFFGYAVGAPVAENDVQMALNPTNKGGSAVVGNKEWTHGGVQKFTVGLSTIDAMLQAEPEMGNVLYAKMDIEGNEGRAIAGAQNFFKHSPPCALFIELNEGFLRNAGTSVEAVSNELSGFGYDIAGGGCAGANCAFRQRDYNGCLSRLH